MAEKEIMLDVQHLCKDYQLKNNRTLKAVDDVSFQIYRGETFGIVGESGCGKTTCGKTCIGMLEASSGRVLYKGEDVHEIRKKHKKKFARQVQMIFQDPYASLDPHQKAYQIVREGIRIHHLASGPEEEKAMVRELFGMVGLNEEHAARNVHEFSGGQRQRIGIARALSVDPEFLFCDEPISALDVLIQAQIMNLLISLQKKRNLTMLFVAHDISMVRHVSDRIGVMYLGKMVEICEAETLFEDACHPYTKALLSAMPVPDPDASLKRKQVILEGDVPDPSSISKGCVFSGRCRNCMKICQEKAPDLIQYKEGHFIACHLYQIYEK